MVSIKSKKVIKSSKSKSKNKNIKLAIGAGAAILSGLAIKKFIDLEKNKNNKNNIQELLENIEKDYKNKLMHEQNANKQLVYQIEACNKEIINQRDYISKRLSRVPSLRENTSLRETIRKFIKKK